MFGQWFAYATQTVFICIFHSDGQWYACSTQTGLSLSFWFPLYILLLLLVGFPFVFCVDRITISLNSVWSPVLYRTLVYNVKLPIKKKREKGKKSWMLKSSPLSWVSNEVDFPSNCNIWQDFSILQTLVIGICPCRLHNVHAHAQRCGWSQGYYPPKLSNSFTEISSFWCLSQKQPFS